ncbi:MAG: amino acid adenylation domain-containing protein [Candidatus Aminicenantes bacterium]|nr:MAG: amino acid adenylation domain-containing protein [Candidatus Aminicenantes bacterium]
MMKLPIQHTLFAAFQKHQQNIAIEWGERKITYAELEKKSNRIARQIVKHGIKKGTFIGIYLEDKFEFISVIIGILTAGCVFVPLDPALPIRRIANMIRAADLEVIFLDSHTKKRLFAEDNLEKVVKPFIVDDWFYRAGKFPGEITCDNDLSYNTYDPEDEIYIYYTSGSTGAPRAIVGKNKSLLHFIEWEINQLKIDETFRISQFSSPGFDAFLRDIFVPLHAGAAICIPSSREMIMGSDSLIKWIDRTRITLINTVPGIFRLFNTRTLTGENFRALKYILLSGEKIIPHELKNWYDTFGERIQLINLYGTTETTMAKTFYMIQPPDIHRDRIPVGKAMPGARVIILDENKKTCGDLEPGEIFIRTPFRTLGYYNEPQLNETIFVQNPFNNNHGDIIHKTGDLGRFLPDGNIDLLGRIDHQVKIRGIRVEPGDVENIISKQEKVKEVVIIDRDDKAGEKYLCAYVSAQEGFEIHSLREALSKELPDYMIPSYIMQVDKFPLTTNGKIDKKALPEPEIKAMEKYRAPKNEIEKKLVEIWAKELHLDDSGIGVDTSFFELGGHSLKVMNLIAKIHKEFDAKITMEDAFNANTVEKQAKLIRAAAKEKYLPIMPGEEKNYYPLTSAQKRMYMLQQMDLNNTAYNIHKVLQFSGNIKIARLEKIFQELVDRHESLRTSFELVKEVPVQRIHRRVEFSFEYDLATGNIEGIHHFIRPFALSQPPLLRVGLIKQDEQKYLLMVDMHHIVSDGVSLEILAGDFIRLYNGEELHKLPLQYKDFAEWQNNEKQKNMIKKQETYWLNKFGNELPELKLQADYPKAETQPFAGDKISLEIGEKETQSLRKLAKSNDVTMFMLLLAVYTLLLAKLSGQDDIIIGTAAAGRGHADLEGIIGMFVNTLALRNRLEEQKTFIQFLEEVKNNTIKDFENQDYQFEELVNKVVKNRSPNRNPLFDVTFELVSLQKQSAGIQEVHIADMNREFKSKKSKFDMSFNGTDTGNNIFLTIEYSLKYKKSTIERMAKHYTNLLQKAVFYTESQLKSIDIISEEEKRQILFEFNNTKKEILRDKCYHQLFEEQVTRTPDKLAAIWRHRQITYQALNEKSNQLAWLLREKGIVPGEPAGIFCERSLEMLAAVLGVFKASAAYVPIDVHYPLARIITILDNSEPKILLAKSNSFQGVYEYLKEIGSKTRVKHIVYLDKTDNLETGTYPSENLKPINKPSSLSYIIYTSGTTGKPKGVAIHQLGMLNHMFAKIHDLSITGGDVIAQTASVCFDISVWQLLAGLLKGGYTFIIDRETLLEPGKFLQALKKGKVTILELVPSLISTFLNTVEHKKDKELSHLRWMIPTGEALSVHLVREWYAHYPGIKMVNAYGPTEASDDVTHYIVNDIPHKHQMSVPIGKPLQNMHIYVMDKNLSLCPIGVRGEICVSGIGVGKGYWKDEEKTDKTFIPNPFLDEIGDDDYAVLYKTGDLGYFRDDGNIECLGRMDYQVKIRGYRIELGEIESELLKCEKIKNAVVVDRTDGSEEKYLCAYIVSGETIDVSELKNLLSVNLPDYMIPTYFKQVEKIPLTSNGKVDRKSLPVPETGGGEIGTKYVPPGDNIQESLVKIWLELLPLRQNASSAAIGIDDNFFELGGHSLTATMMAAKIHKELEVNVPLAEIFKTPSIRMLSRYIKGTSGDKFSYISAAEKKDYYRVSPAQKRLYIIQRMNLNSTAYNLPKVVILEGELNKEKSEAILRKLIKRHESLRTSFTLAGDELVQEIHNDVEFRIEYYEACEAQGEESYATIIENFVRPFDLSKPELLRAGLIKIGVDQFILMVDMHHIITDGTSQDILTREFTDLYWGEELVPLHLHLQYKDFSEWQNKILESEKIKKQESYWLKKFESRIPVLDLPTDYPRPLIQRFEGDELSGRIEKEETRVLKKYALEEGATLFMVLLSLTSLLLAKLSGQEDIIIGTPVAGRRHADLEKIIGMFVNTLPLRNYPSPGKTFRQFIKEIKGSTLEALENQEYPFEELVERVTVNRDTGRNPLFDMMFILQNTVFDRDSPQALASAQQQQSLPGDKINKTNNTNKTKTAKFDITLSVSEAGEDLVFSLEYSTTLFKKETIKRFIRYFNRVVSVIAREPGIKLGQIEIISEEERKQVLETFNDTGSWYPKPSTIHQLFAGQVERTPDHIAVLEIHQTHEIKPLKGTRGLAPLPGVRRTPPIRSNMFITYRQLNKKSHQLAYHLIGQGVQPNTIVAIKVERSIEMIVGIFAVLKADAAYLPIEPEYPAERIKYMLQDSNAGILLDMASMVSNVAGREPTPQEVSKPAAQLAYIIYTSGSAGKPKGVMVEHLSVVNVLFTLNKQYPFHESSVYLLKTSFAFDVSVTELFGWFLGKGKLAILEKGGEKDPETILDTIESARITHINFAPSMFNVFTDSLNPENIGKLSHLQFIFLAGEVLLPQSVNQFRTLNSKVKLENLYGPTEATVYASKYSLADWVGKGAIPIGSPLQNMKLYILDKNDNLQPIGVPGELCIAGPGVARGYLNQPGLTAEKFCLRHPGRALFEKSPWQGRPIIPPGPATLRKNFLLMGTRGLAPLLYKTGDRALWLPDGNIEFLGRIDQQVKIRGFRIEPGEIEAKLMEIDGITATAVIDKKDDNGQGYLCAYIVSKKETMTSQLRNILSSKLPGYMIPSYFIHLDQIPLTPNGKVDRKALPIPEPVGPGSAYTAPENKLQERLAEIWSKVIGIEKEKISIDANFFELGGHSLKATIMAARIWKTLNVKVPLAEIFKNPTIRGAAQYINTTAEDKYDPIPFAAKKEYYPLSSAQKRMYILNELEGVSTTYNMPGVMKIEGKLDRYRFQETFRALIKRHETLRTSFTMREGQLVQVINNTSNLDFKIDYLETKEHECQELIGKFIRPFDPGKSPLLRVLLIRLSETKYIFLFDMPHIISDGMSMNILVREFVRLYEGTPLSELRIQYKDYSQWQNRFIESDIFNRQERYWLKTLEGNLPVLRMPLDFKRPNRQTFEGRSLSFALPGELTEKLNRFAGKQNITLNILLLSLYALLISQYSSQTDMIIGSLTAGRNHPDLENIIGMFGNFLPIRITIPTNQTFIEFLNSARETIIKAYENQDYPFEIIIERLNLPVDLSRNPIFDTLLNFHNEADSTAHLEIEGLKFSPYEFENNISTLDFKMDVLLDNNKRLNGSIQYNINLFKEETIKRFIHHFPVLIKNVIENPYQKISKLDLLTEEEKAEFARRRKLRTAPAAKPVKLAVSATFIPDPVKEYIKWWGKQFALEIDTAFAPYNQVFQELLDETGLISANLGVNVLLIRFEDWIRDVHLPDKEICEKLERDFQELVRIFKNKPKTVPYLVGIFPVSMYLSLSPHLIDYLENMYVRWKKIIEETTNAYITDFTSLGELYDIIEVFDAVTDREGHLPFKDEYYAAIGTTIGRKLCGLYNPPFKVIVLDCDNTLWGGICGEDGPTGVRVEDHYRELQVFMLQKYNEGMLLTICSKNNEADVWDVFEKNPRMLLKKKHFVGWKINWKTKSENIKELAQELNLGIDSLIFVDDSPVECSEVMSNCPEVFTLQLPENPAAIPLFLKHVWAFDRLIVTDEDRTRSRMYLTEKKRKESQKQSLSLKDFLSGLEIKVAVNVMKNSHISRVSQLTQRTNQFNLSTIRRNESEIMSLTLNKGTRCWVIEVSDRFGDYGLVGVIITREKPGHCHLFIDTFLLSCRVLGREVEETVLVGLKTYCRQRGLKTLEADFYPTKKNQPFLNFLQNKQNKWIEQQKHEKYTTYTLPVDHIPDSCEFARLYFQKTFKKELPGVQVEGNPTTTSLKYNFFNKHETGTTVLPGPRWQKNIPPRDKRNQLLHQSHYLPIENYTGKMLLDLPVDTVKGKLPVPLNDEEPRDETDNKLMQIWQEILKIEITGIGASFFELGGNSLKAITMVSKIHKEFNVSLHLHHIFNHPFIKQLSDLIKKSEKSVYSSIQPSKPKDHYAMASAQKRLYILQQIELDNTAYNMSIVVILEGKLKRQQFEEAFRKLINRHESLRTCFVMIEEEPMQEIQAEVEFEIEYYNLATEDKDKRITSLPTTYYLLPTIKDFIRPFDLSQAPLLRVGLIKLETERHILMVDMHHIVSDGTSMNLLTKDFITFYSGQELPHLRIQYKDYCEWQHHLLTSGKIKSQEKYWLDHFSGEVPVLNMPTDYPRPSIQRFEGDSISFYFEKELSGHLHRLMKETGTTLYMMLLALYNITLSKYTGQEDIIIGSPTAGRNHADLENIIGLLMETLVIRNYPEEDKTFEEFLEEVKKNALDAFENQAYPFGELLKHVWDESDRSRNPLFDSMLIVQNMNTDAGPGREEPGIEGLRVIPYEGASHKVSKVDFTLEAEEKEDKIFFILEYCTKLFKRETMERLISSFKEIVLTVVRNKTIKLGDIRLSHDLLTAVSSSAYKGAESEFDF